MSISLSWWINCLYFALSLTLYSGSISPMLCISLSRHLPFISIHPAHFTLCLLIARLHLATSLSKPDELLLIYGGENAFCTNFKFLKLFSCLVVNRCGDYMAICQVIPELNGAEEGTRCHLRYSELKISWSNFDSFSDTLSSAVLSHRSRPSFSPIYKKDGTSLFIPEATLVLLVTLW